MSVRIVDIREITKPISPIRNAFIDFSKMTLSLVAVVTDVIRDGKPVVGYGFNSNGRYGQGGPDPRALRAAPARGRRRQPARRQRRQPRSRTRSGRCMMTNEKPGGHGERSVAVGTIDMAVWDAVAKIAGQPLHACWPSVTATARPTRGCSSTRPAATTTPARASTGCGEMQGYLDRGYTRRQDEDRRRAAGTRTAPHRGGAAMLGPGPAAGGGCQRPLRPAEDRRSPTPRRCASTRCSGTRKPATRSTTRCRPSWRALRRADGDRREPVLDAGRAQPDPLRRHAPDRDWLQFDCALSYGLVEYLRTLDMLKDARLVAPPLHAARRAPDVAEHRRRPGPGRQRELPGPVPALRRLPRRRAGGERPRHLPPLPGIGFEGKADLAMSVIRSGFTLRSP
jgi:hypothetical protein